MTETVSRTTLEHLVKETDIVLVISGYTALEHHGVLYTGRCPICESDKNRLVINPARFLWRCFNCGRHGNVVDFLVEKECFSEVEAVKLLAGKAFDPKHAHLANKAAAKTKPATPDAVPPEPEAPAPEAPEPEAVIPPAPPAEAPAPVKLEFKPAENLFTLLRGVTGYKTAAVLADDLSVLAEDAGKGLESKPLFSEFMHHLAVPLQGLHKIYPEFNDGKALQLTLRSLDGALIVVSDRYDNQQVYLMCLLSGDGNLVLTRRYMADLLAQQAFLI